jgi:hypothetical protein
VAFQFALPFVLLLLRRTKSTPGMLMALAFLVIGVHVLDLFWLVVPPFRTAGLSIHWLDIVAPVGIGGIWIAGFIWLLKRVPVLPQQDPGDPRVQEAFEHA